MALAVEKLRWVLLAGGVLLVLVLAGLLGYSRFQALRAWHRVLERTGATLSRESNGITWSQSVGGRTVFTVHAAKAVQAKDGKYALHDVALTLYRQAGGLPDRVYGAEFEYDQKTGVARALGEVHMDLQAPGGIRDQADASKQPANVAGVKGEAETIHVKTSNLVYVRNLGVAATDQEVEFRYNGLECHAHGAEFNSGQSTVHLLGDVQASGELRGHPVKLTAARADVDRRANLATLVQLGVQTADGMASAADAVLHLRTDGTLASAEANGAVRLLRGTQTVDAAKAEVELTPDSTLRAVRLSGGVTLSDNDKLRPLHGRAQALRASFGPRGAPGTAVAEGGVWIEALEKSAAAAAWPGIRREIGGDRLTATFATTTANSKPAVSQLRIDGHASLLAESPAKAVSSAEKRDTSGPGSQPDTRVAADTLLVRFAPAAGEGMQPQTAEGEGHTSLEQNGAEGARRRSSGDRLHLQFEQASARDKGKQARVAPGRGVQVESAVQEGHVVLRNVAAADPHRLRSAGEPLVTEATAERADFVAGRHRLLLTGQAHVWSQDGDLLASKVELDAESGDAEATEQVRVTLLRATGSQAARPRPAPPQPAPSGRAASQESPLQATHVMATRARFLHSAGTAEFFGSDAQPARLWQGASQLEAATLLLDRLRNTFSARPETPGGLVHAVLVQQPALNPEHRAAARGSTSAGIQRLPSSSAGAETFRVSSAQLDYSGVTGEASFSGGVRLNGALGDVSSRSALVFLRPAGDAVRSSNAAGVADSTGTLSNSLLGSSLERIILSGKVELKQTGRFGTGEQLLYTAASSTFVLTGSLDRPPRVVDARQGNLSGATLLFRTSDNTVVVAGGPAQTGAVRNRVRTELTLHP